METVNSILGWIGTYSGQIGGILSDIGIGGGNTGGSVGGGVSTPPVYPVQPATTTTTTFAGIPMSTIALLAVGYLIFKK